MKRKTAFLDDHGTEIREGDYIQGALFQDSSVGQVFWDAECGLWAIENIYSGGSIQLAGAGAVEVVDAPKIRIPA